jgi:DNA-binding Lrp family transcriptional regulator
MNFTEKEQDVLRIVQKNLPDTLTPYADIAASVGMTESEVLDLLQRLKDSGAIRRFGASIKHQRTGWTHNAMVAWIVDPAHVEEVGAVAADHPRISHCYYRPSVYPEWPYTFYTMIHGRTEQECLDVVSELCRTTVLEKYEILESLKELKKISMTYFPDRPINKTGAIL